MLLSRQVFVVLFLVLELCLAVNYISVQRDVTPPCLDPDSEDYEDNNLHVWSGTFVFNQQVTNRQLVRIAEHGYVSMVEGIQKAGINPKKWMPAVMAAMVYPEGNNYRVTLTSASKGYMSLIYQVTASMERRSQGRQKCNTEIWETVPDSLRNALNTCKERTGKDQQHGNQGSCGEMNAILAVAARTGQNPQNLINGGTMVAWQGYWDNKKKEYTGGHVKEPCWYDDGYGCSDTLEELAQGLTAIDDETLTGEAYDPNNIIEASHPGLFPGLNNVV